MVSVPTRNESTKEKPSFLLFGMDQKLPTEASLLPPVSDPTHLGRYILGLFGAVAVVSQGVGHDKYPGANIMQVNYHRGDWVFVRFPEEETGKGRKLSDAMVWPLSSDHQRRPQPYS